MEKRARVRKDMNALLNEGVVSKEECERLQEALVR